MLALAEPYRTTVLLRFFEDLSAEEIATRQELPVETVRTRLKRGMARLRAELGQEGRDWREEWAVVLAGLRDAPRSPRPVAWSLAGGALVAGAAVWYWSRPKVVLEIARPAPEAVGSLASPGAVLSAASGARTALPSKGAPPAPRATWEARVVDREGRPLAGVDVWLGIHHFDGAEELSLLASDADGTFRTTLGAWHALAPYGRELLALQLVVSKPGHAQLLHELELGDDGLPRETGFVLEPGRLASARVLAPEGGPAAFVQGTFVLRQAAGAERRAATISNSQGWIRDTLAPDEKVVGFLAFSPAHGRVELGESDLPPAVSGDVALGVVRLERGGTLRGRVAYPDGSPARALRFVTRPVVHTPEGTVALDPEAGSVPPLGGCTDAEGRFEVRGLREGLHQLVSPPKALAGGEAFATDGPAIELRVEFTRLVVEVADEDGRLLEEARVAVTRLDDAGVPESPPLRRLTGRDPPCRALELAPGRYAVLAWAPGAVAPERIVSVPARPGDTPLRLTLEPEPRDATLVLNPRTGSCGAWRVDVLAPLSLVPLSGLQDLVPDEHGRIARLPRGACAVRVEPHDLDPDTEPTTCVATPLPARLAAGDNVLDFAPVPAARLRLVFGADAEPSDAVPLRAEDLNGIGAGTERFAWIDGTVVGPFWRLELRPAEGGAPLQRLPSLRPRAGTVIDAVVPARPLALALTLDGRPHLVRELAPTPGTTLEIRVPLPMPAHR